MSTFPRPASPVQTDPDEYPMPRHLSPAAALLAGLGYPPQAVDAALAHLGLFGSAECCPAISPGHRARVEALLPRDPAWQSPEWDAGWWAPTA